MARADLGDPTVTESIGLGAQTEELQARGVRRAAVQSAVSGSDR